MSLSLTIMMVNKLCTTISTNTKFNFSIIRRTTKHSTRAGKAGITRCLFFSILFYLLTYRRNTFFSIFITKNTLTIVF